MLSQIPTTLDFPFPIRRFDEFDASIVDVKALEPNRLSVTGRSAGTTTIEILDTDYNTYFVEIDVVDAKSADVRDQVGLLAAWGESNIGQIKTAHLKVLRTALTPSRPLATPTCDTILQRHEPIDRPEKLPGLLTELVGGEQVTSPWQEVEVHQSGKRIRQSMRHPNGGCDTVIVRDGVVIKWSSSLSQIDILPCDGFREGVQTWHQLLGHLWPDRVSPSSDTTLERQRGFAKVTRKQTQLVGLARKPYTMTTELVVSERTGLETLARFQDSAVPDYPIRESRRLTWDQSACGLCFPRCVVRFEVAHQDQPKVEVDFVTEADFNVPLNESLFVMSASAGTMIIDHRPESRWRKGRISHDVADVLALGERDMEAKQFTEKRRADRELKKWRENCSMLHDKWQSMYEDAAREQTGEDAALVIDPWRGQILIQANDQSTPELSAALPTGLDWFAYQATSKGIRGIPFPVRICRYRDKLQSEREEEQILILGFSEGLECRCVFRSNSKGHQFGVSGGLTKFHDESIPLPGSNAPDSDPNPFESIAIINEAAASKWSESVRNKWGAINVVRMSKNQPRSNDPSDRN